MYIFKAGNAMHTDFPKKVLFSCTVPVVVFVKTQCIVL